jgi:integrase
MQFIDFANAMMAARGSDSRFKSVASYWIQYFNTKDHLSITVDDVDAGIAALALRGKLKQIRGKGLVPSGQPLTGATLNRHIACIGALYKTGKKLKIVPKTYQSPSLLADKAQESPGRTIHLTKDEIERIMQLSHLVRWRKFPALVAVALSSGARKSNLENLKWRDVDLDKGILYFPTSKNGRSYSAAISPQAIHELKKIKEGTHQEELVFGKRSIRKSWQSTLQLAGIEYFCWHGCRHVAASMLANAGASTLVVMQQLNHSSTSMARRYAHGNTDILRSDVARAWG